MFSKYRPIIVIPLNAIVILLCLCSGGKAFFSSEGNFFSNPSFEQSSAPNQFGHTFPHWAGWVYATPSYLTIGDVARTGKRSYGLVSASTGKVRFQSELIKLSSGRYRVTCYIRGLSVGDGSSGRPLDFSVGFDNKFPVLKKTGTFGWTPVHYVFDVDKPEVDCRLMVGLLTDGWLWIDDASLEKVDQNTPLTIEPVIGSEETPFADPLVAGEDTVHCNYCGLLNSVSQKVCRGCGLKVSVPEKVQTSKVMILNDFENGSSAPFSGGRTVLSDLMGGKYALQSKELISNKSPQNWTEYDFFHFDVYNPQASSTQIYVEIRDRLTTGYWSRVNYTTVVPPGKSTVSLPTDLYVGEKSRPGRPLEKDSITHLFINPQENSLYFDDFRLEAINAQEHQFAGLKAFDFGTLDSPVMEGFLGVTSAMKYEPDRGFGWSAGQLWRSFDVLQPDALLQDFICPGESTFRVDLPNGKYKVVMNIDSPGGYWGEVQAFKQRQVKANGRLVVDETNDIQAFKKQYFRNAHREDLPGIDTFNAYVEQMSHLKEFEVAVTNGSLELAFKGEAFANCLSSLVIFPLSQAKEGQDFLSWVKERRRFQFESYFKQVKPASTGKSLAGKGPVLFSRNFMMEVNPFDGPLPGEEIPEKGLSITVAQGEEMPLTFSLQPGGDLGEIDLELSSLEIEGKSQGEMASLPSSAVVPGWIDYRLKRITMEGTVYSVGPRYWHPVPAPSAPGVTRRFWLRVKPPVGTSPGVYVGALTVKPQRGEATRIKIKVTVLPFALDPIQDVAVGPWGAGIALPWVTTDPEKAKWEWSSFEKSLSLLKEAGATSFSGIPHLEIKAKNGTIFFDTRLADREMALARSLGFSHMVSSYGIQSLGYRLKGDNNGSDEAFAKSAGFPGAYSFLKELYSAVDRHAESNNWLPVAWNICDEPVDGAIKGAVANALAHRDASKELKRTTFMGATSMTGDSPSDPHYLLVQSLPVPALNNHDEESIELAKKAGNTPAFYNDGNRWTYGRYLKMLVNKYGLGLRLTWHFNVVAGDPYYALDCREDDYNWYNTDANHQMIPSVNLLGQFIPGLNDYRYLVTLENLVAKEKSPVKSEKGRKVLERLLALRAGEDKQAPSNLKVYEESRKEMIEAINALLH